MRKQHDNNRAEERADERRLNRRDMLKNTATVAAGLAAGMGLSGRRPAEAASRKSPAKRRNRIKQGLVTWTYMDFGEQWSIDQHCQATVDLGGVAIDLAGPDQWPTMKEYGLTCACADNGMPGPPFEKGLNNPRYQPEVMARTRERLEQCAAADVPAVIAFTGFKYGDLDNPDAGIIPPDVGADNTVQGLKELALDAERHNVTICLEHLNSRVEGDDVRGHPGYQGDDIDYCADIIRRVGSPNVKLLFDIYHVQIMNGDLIARIREYGTDLIGHIHTAGVPGRVELDENQELYYPPIMEALLEIGYDGYVTHEFIPTRDPMAGLEQAFELCDV